jgi:hypothetical protein
MKYDDRRITDTYIMASKGETAGSTIHFEHSDVITSLVATVKKIARGYKVKATWIVSSCPFFADVRKRTILTHGKDTNAVM